MRVSLLELEQKYKNDVQVLHVVGEIRNLQYLVQQYLPTLEYANLDYDIEDDVHELIHGIQDFQDQFCT